VLLPSGKEASGNAMHRGAIYAAIARRNGWTDGRMDEWKEIRDPLEQKT